MQRLYDYFNNLPPYLEIAIVTFLPILIIVVIVFALSKTTHWFEWNKDSKEILKDDDRVI